jgi:ABC-type branched-subunit amino acid transport system substrate-binding protein
VPEYLSALEGAARVAVVGPFSGPRSAWGRLLVDSLVVAGDGVRWMLYNDGGDADLGRRRAEEIVRDGGYSAVIGHFNSRGARAALPLYRAAGIPCLLPLATEPGLTALSGGLVLRWCATDDGQVLTLLRALVAAGHTVIDVVTDGNPYMAGLASRFVTTDLDGVLIRMLLPGRVASGPRGAVVVVAVHREAALLARRLRARGFRGQLAFTDDCAVDEFAELGGSAVTGALVTTQRGGAAGRVDTAVACLASALAADPGLVGPDLIATVKEHSPVAFTAAGEPAFDGWTVTRLPLGGQAAIAA